MKEKLPFEETFKKRLSNLPVPDAGEAWLAMRRLLDKEEKRPLFFFINKREVKTGLLLLLSLLLWLMIAPEQKKPVKNKNLSAQKQQNTVKKSAAKTAENRNNKVAKTDSGLSAFATQIVTTKKATDRNGFLNKKKDNNTVTANASAGKYKNMSNETAMKTLRHARDFYLKKSTNEATVSTDAFLPDNDNRSNAIINQKDSPVVVIPVPATPNLTHKNVNDSLQQASGEASSKALVVAKKQKVFFADGGIQISQTIPVNGQAFSSYHYNGSKTWLPDYLPSVYIRLQRNRWFVQGAFNYAVPRYVKPFSYSRQTSVSYAHSSVSTINLYLKKTWYTQLPLSLHYYVHPHWSVGAGVVYNRLRGAVAEQKTTTGDARSGTLTEAEQIMPVKGYRDSFLYQSNWSLLLQTDYTKNKWLFGLRFASDLQPFIAYTLPDGKRVDKKNTSLQLFIGYRLFRVPATKPKK